MPESWATRRARWLFNWFPAYRGTGARVEYIAADWHEVRIRLPLSWRTRNYVGTIFGGSLYAAVDPFYMIMFMKILGPDFVVWDKAATIRFRRPGRTTLYATFRLTPEAVREARDAAIAEGKIERDFGVDLADAEGVVHASSTKTIHIRWGQAASPPGLTAT
jgi:acyl-coenzyme A thioesterase PaaI-like protein